MSFGFPSPYPDIGGFLDQHRPDGFQVNLTVLGSLTLCQWSSASGLWFPLSSQIVIQPATPMSSPVTASTVPMSGPGFSLHPSTAASLPSQPTGSPSQPTFPPLSHVQEPPYTLSARMLLEISPPTFCISQTGDARLSSSTNMFYSNVGGITKLALPNDLSGYNNLPTTYRYHPIQGDPTLDLSVEADAVRACLIYLVGPVNLALYNNSYNIASNNSYCHIRSKCEDTHSVNVQSGSTYVNHVSRVDLSWEVKVSNVWYKFAFLEFKRPGALKQREWAAATNGTGPVEGTGERICRQLVKYGYSWGVNFVCTCDWESMALLRLGGNRGQWYNAQQLAPLIQSQGVWISDRLKMKRGLFVFLKLALKVFLQERNIAVSQ